MIEFHISLVSAALAAAINLWLSIRCGKARTAGKVLHGDGGDVALGRHMRAHANFIEYTPIALVLILVLELAGQAGHLLAWSALAFLAGRVLHALGMQSDTPSKLRMAGMFTTLVPYAIWIVWAGMAAFGHV